MQGIANGGLLLAVMVLCSVYLYGQSGTAEAHYDTGIKALEGGDLNGAEQQFRATLKLRPDFFEARQNLAITLAQKGNLREAAAEFRKLIEQRLRSPETHYNLGLVLFQERDSNPALEQFRKALELKPDYPEARNNLGLLLEQMGDFKGAISELQTIIQLHPQYAEARNNLGHVLCRMATLTARLPNIAPPWEYALTFLKPLRISAWYCGGSMTLMGQRWNFAPRRLRVEREELAIVPCQGEGPYASCPKIRRAVDAGQNIPALEGDVATLSIEVEVQRNSLVQITAPSFELTRTLEGCEQQRRVVDEERQRHEEMRAVEARREKRLKAAFDPTVAEALRHDSSVDRVFEKLQDSSGGSAQTA